MELFSKIYKNDSWVKIFTLIIKKIIIIKVKKVNKYQVDFICKKIFKWWGRYFGDGENVLILVSKEPLYKVLLIRINIIIICFPPLERLRWAILISIFSPKQVPLNINLNYSKFTLVLIFKVIICVRNNFHFFSSHCNIILNTIQTF